jgi:hypothetical protein
LATDELKGEEKEELATDEHRWTQMVTKTGRGQLGSEGMATGESKGQGRATGELKGRRKEELATDEHR